MYHYSYYGNPDEDCPPATQDQQLNAKNRARTIKQFGYGPKDPTQKNHRFWDGKARRWKLPIALASMRLCGNCSVFNISEDMVDCGGANENGTVGFCEGHKFSCSAYRTCDTWSPGGPKTD